MHNTAAKIEPQSVFTQAERFNWSYQRLCVGTLDDVHEMALIPAMALSAFASKLFLKCLHHIDSGKVPEKIHALQELFAELPELRRNRIEFLWNNHMVAKSAEYELVASQDRSPSETRAACSRAAAPRFTQHFEIAFH